MRGSIAKRRHAGALLFDDADAHDGISVKEKMRIHRRNFLEVVGVAAAASLRGFVPALAEESVVPAPQGDGLSTGSTATPASASGQTIVVSRDWKDYSPANSYWWALDNAWNTGNLVRGTDYTQSVTVHTGTFPNSTTIAWNFGSHMAPSNVWGYPEIIYGRQAGWWASPNGLIPTPIQLRNLTRFLMSWNISLSGNLNLYDVLAETHFATVAHPTSSAQKATEWGLFIWSPPYCTAYLNGLSPKWNYTNSNGITVQITVTPDFVQILPISVRNGTPMLIGTNFDLLGILNYCITNELIEQNYYVTGFELGVEAQQGSGTMTINSLSFDWG
jgi:hypothetical protein